MIDVDVASNEIMRAEQRTYSQAFQQANTFVDPWECWQPVEGLLRHLQTLSQGQYLLSYIPGSGRIHVLKAWKGLVSPQVIISGR